MRKLFSNCTKFRFSTMNHVYCDGYGDASVLKFKKSPIPVSDINIYICNY